MTPCFDGLYFFDKKSASSAGVKNENKSNQKLAKELHKLIIRKFGKRKIHSFL